LALGYGEAGDHTGAEAGHGQLGGEGWALLHGLVLDWQQLAGSSAWGLGFFTWR
jgi:hypothetical protein